MIAKFIPEPDIDSFVKVIKGEMKPQRVHFVELFLDRDVVKEIGEKYFGLIYPESDGSLEAEKRFWDFAIQVYYRLGYDFLWVWGRPIFPANPRITEDTASKNGSHREWAETGKGPISTWDDFNRYPWPTLTEEDLELYYYVSSRLPEGMGMFVANGDGFLEVVSNILIGYENMCYMQYDDMDLLKTTIDMAASIICDSVKKMIEIPKVAGVFIGDDMGFGTSTLFSADFLRKHILPWHKILAEITHDRGLLYMLHSCGNLKEIMEDLIEDVKIDAKHSFQEDWYPVTEFKKKYGNRIGVLGGVDMDRLCRYEEGELRKYIRSILDCCMEGGRYAFGSGNSIANYVPLKNYFIMLEEGRNYKV